MSAVWLLIDSRSVGGAERHIASLAGALQRRGVEAEVVLYADYGSNPWLDQLALAGIQWRVLHGSPLSLFAALLKFRPGLLHTHGYKAGILGRIAATLIGVPVVSTFHSGGRSPFPVSAYDRVDAWTSFLGGRIAVSQPIAERLPFTSSVIPSFVVVAAGQNDTPFSRKVAFVGRLSAEKGPDLFCEIARRSPPGLEWHVYGDGIMRGALEREFGDIVNFHGLVVDLDGVWDDIGLLLMPSRFEGVPLSALEALSRGVPVLASRVGGVPSVVVPGATGWLFEANDIDQALTRLDDWCTMEPSRQLAMRQSCRRHVSDTFGECAIMPKVLDVYRHAGLDNACPRATQGAAS